jgi:hypothetical protein
MRPLEASDAIEVVEGTVVAEEAVELAGTSSGTGTALAVIPERARGAPALRRLSGVPALLWRQPGVRAAVKTGAGTVMLTLALRAARQVAARRSLYGASGSMLPTLADLLRGPEEARRRQGTRTAQVTETFIYIRRVTRR